MSKQTSKNHKNSHNSPVVLRWHEKKIESNKRQRILFRPQRWDVPYRNHQACCEKLWFVRSISPNLSKMGQNFYHGMLMPLHDSIQSFMNFRRVSGLLQFKYQASQCFAGNQRCPGVWNSFAFLAWDLSMHPRTHIWVSTNLYALEHVHVVQIWIMHINALKTLLMHKNVQTNSENNNNSHNTPVVLCWHEKKI